MNIININLKLYLYNFKIFVINLKIMKKDLMNKGIENIIIKN